MRLLLRTATRVIAATLALSACAHAGPTPVKVAIAGASLARLADVRIEPPEVACSGERQLTAEPRICMGRGICTIAPPAYDCTLPGKPVIITVTEEDYLAAVVASEIGGKAPLEAQKAQAVASRSYLRARLKERAGAAWDVDATVNDQVFNPAKTTELSRQAASETADVVLTHNGSALRAFFHSSCGGATTTPLQIWGADAAGFAGVPCPLPAARHSRWSCEVDQAWDWAGAVVDGSGRIAAIGNVPGNSIRKSIGYDRMKSTLIESHHTQDGKTVLNGRGHGHGAGMCQQGAIHMAEGGIDYLTILTTYYPLATIGKAD